MTVIPIYPYYRPILFMNKYKMSSGVVECLDQPPSALPVMQVGEKARSAGEVFLGFLLPSSC